MTATQRKPHFGMECYVYVGARYTHGYASDCQNAVRTKRCWRTTTTNSRWRKWRRELRQCLCVCICVFYVYIFLFVSFIRYLNSMSVNVFFFLLFCLISFLQSNWFFRFTQLHSFQCLSVSSVFFLFSYLFISLVYH